MTVYDPAIEANVWNRKVERPFRSAHALRGIYADLRPLSNTYVHPMHTNSSAPTPVTVTKNVVRALACIPRKTSFQLLLTNSGSGNSGEWTSVGGRHIVPPTLLRIRCICSSSIIPNAHNRTSSHFSLTEDETLERRYPRPPPGRLLAAMAIL